MKSIVFREELFFNFLLLLLQAMNVSAVQSSGGVPGADRDASGSGSSGTDGPHTSTGGSPQAMDIAAGTGTGLDLGGGIPAM
jgi:hypothetical protein